MTATAPVHAGMTWLLSFFFVSHKLKGEIVFLFLRVKPTKTNTLWKKMEEDRIGFLKLY